MTSSPTPKRIILQTRPPLQISALLLATTHDSPYLLLLSLHHCSNNDLLIFTCTSWVRAVPSVLLFDLLSPPCLLCFWGRKDRTLPIIASLLVHPVTSPPTSPRPVSFSHCLPAGRIKLWVFMSGPESSLPSPLTVPMATGSSVAADGGSLPKTSTWPRKVEVEWGTVAVDGGGCLTVS